MSAVQDVIDELRFDMIDEQNTDVVADAHIVVYLQRGVDLIYDIIVSMRANIGITIDTTTYSVDGTTTITNPVALAGMKSVNRVYRNDVDKPLVEAGWDEIIYLNRKASDPRRWVFMDEALYVAPQPDQTYNLTLFLYPDVVLTAVGDMPFSGRMDHYIRDAARALFMARNEHDLKAYMAIRDHFKREAMTYLERLQNQGLRTTDLAWGYEDRL